MPFIKVYLTSFIVLISCSLWAQFQTKPFNSKIKSLTITRSDSNISYPVIYLNKPSDAIAINFDLMASEMHQITYTVVHCDAEWRPSDLAVNEYLDGFQDNYLENYEYSRSTNVDYVNYQLFLPNDDIQMRLSGNYAVVFYDQDIEDTVAVACFSLVESLTQIYGTVSGISGGGRSSKKQQLNFTIDHPDFGISQPLIESKVVVQRNGSRHYRVVENTPTYIHTNRLVYEQHPKMIFPGGGEYRLFETSSLRYCGEGILKIDYFSPFYHVTLRPDAMRQLQQYEYDDDINGKFLIRRQESEDGYSNTEADYLVAHFTLPMEDPVLDGKVYLGGGFVYDALDETSQMKYNPERKAYEAHLLLKQGYYNYRYFLRSNRDGSLNSAPFEMDAFQTENDYQVFVYYRELGARYDRLVGYQILNSLR